MSIKKYLEQRFLYGGEIKELGSIILDLQRIAPTQQCVDRYLQGLFLAQKPIP